MSSLEELIQVGHDITSLKYYSAALATLQFYDYFLMLSDEVQYVWKKKKSWVFVGFLLIRYMPMVYTVWFVITNHDQLYTYEMCSRTAFLEVLVVVFCTLIAQTMLNLRIYALTMKNKIVSGFFACITISQLALGLSLTVKVANTPAQFFPLVPLSAYHLCIFASNHKMEVIYVVISLIYDSLAFVVIVVLALRAKFCTQGIPDMLRTIVRDAAVYFAVIFTSHLVLAITLFHARPSIQLLPAMGNSVYLSIMISRIMLSLREAAGIPYAGWSITSIMFAPETAAVPSGRLPRSPPVDITDGSEGSVLHTEEDIPLEAVSSSNP